MKYPKIAVIPDTQCKPGVPLNHLTAAGNYIAEKCGKGDIIVQLGDMWDFPSLSEYERDKPAVLATHDVEADIASGNEGMRLLNKALGRCKAERIILRGNHENRTKRAIQKDPKLRATLAESRMESPGWKVIPFLRPIERYGVSFVHYWGSPGKAWTGKCDSILKRVGRSFFAGHKQGKDPAEHWMPGGACRRGYIVGSFYQHEEDYLGPQENSHWRGIVFANEVRNGAFDAMELSLDYLMRRYL